jgi:hypothetical protein
MACFKVAFAVGGVDAAYMFLGAHGWTSPWSGNLRFPKGLSIDVTSRASTVEASKPVANLHHPLG